MSAETMMAAFNFTSQDLAENIEGSLSSAQAQRLAQRQLMRTRNRYPMILLLGGVAAFTSYYFLGRWEILTNVERQFSVSLTVALWIALLYAMMRTAQMVSKYRQDLIGGVVDSSCGSVVLREGRFLWRKRYALFRKGIRFDLTEEQFKTLETDGNYCLYFAPFSRTLLAVVAFSGNGS